MTAGKVHHWKHGWIPLDAWARRRAAKKLAEHREIVEAAAAQAAVEAARKRKIAALKGPRHVYGRPMHLEDKNRAAYLADVRRSRR